MRSGLVRLLDQLCSMVDDQKPLDDVEEGVGDEEDSLHRVTALAWAAFRVLADHCVSWESQDSAVLSSGLAKQVGQWVWPTCMRTGPMCMNVPVFPPCISTHTHTHKYSMLSMCSKTTV